MVFRERWLLQYSQQPRVGRRKFTYSGGHTSSATVRMNVILGMKRSGDPTDHIKTLYTTTGNSRRKSHMRKSLVGLPGIKTGPSWWNGIRVEVTMRRGLHAWVALSLPALLILRHGKCVTADGCLKVIQELTRVGFIAKPAGLYKFVPVFTVYLQGIILGPVLFYLFTNDKPRPLNWQAQLGLYVDDITVYTRSAKAHTAVQYAQTHFKKLENDLRQWRIEINVGKCEHVMENTRQLAIVNTLPGKYPL
ncbi:hypothetical protein PR048_021116 [Dryococelus australis]|uniref:Reverse transcriptase domain-containing protein n=1 Tax=Dryococelus australis TaxID=614101 RepID=A0ABQ9GXA4_9NEOP|nr:hypothetical protein PR048_021116 [Dryococelus australis]